MFFLENLSQQVVHRGLPWESPHSDIPDNVRADKVARDKWAANSSLKHCIYSFWEGVNSNGRVNTKKNSSNPPYAMHGMVIDLDAVVDDARLESIVCSLPWPVTYIERTLTEGYARLISVFEVPLKFPSTELAEYFLAKLYEDLKLKKLYGIDEGAFLRPHLYYTSSGRFKQVGGKVSEALVYNKFVSIIKSYKWMEFATECDIPLGVIRKKLSEEYPAFNTQWSGPFELETQGPTFWVAESTSPKSAILKKHGFYTFSAHAAKPFFTWSELLGADFVKSYQEARLGEAVASIYRVRTDYIMKKPNGGWGVSTEKDVLRFLCQDARLSAKAVESGISPTQQALKFIHDFHMCQSVGNWIYHPDGRMIQDGMPVFNICTRRVLEPAPEPAIWGENGNMPWHSQYLGSLFSSGEQLPFFLSWFSHFYKGAYKLKPMPGQAVIIAGGVGVGKSLLSTYIISKIMGGHRDAAQMVTGKDTFGGECFEAGVWILDDASKSYDYKSHRQYSEILKAAVANHTMRCHYKHLTPSQVIWLGRVVVTCNTDARSIRTMIPDMEISTMDKVSLFRTIDARQSSFSDLEIIDRELPYLARYLLDYQIPEECRLQDDRFYVKPYHDESLMSIARGCSSTSSFREALLMWLELFFKAQPQAKFWEGTAVKLFSEMALDNRLDSILRDFNTRSMPIELEKLEQTDFPITSIIDNGNRIWKIDRQ